MPCSWRPASSRTSSRASTSNSRTTSPSPICKFACARSFRASSSRARRGGAASSLYGPFTSAKGLRAALQVLQRIFKFRTCTLDIAEATRVGAGFGRASCTASTNARLRAISASRARTTASRFEACAWCLEGKKGKLLARNGQGDGRGQRGAAVREGGPPARRDRGAQEPQPARPGR